jgi:hypothetical protein
MANPVVVDLSPCLIWKGATVRGYGVRKVGGRQGKVLYVHRMVCEAVHGPAKGRLALHRCNHPLCYNPEHLYWGDKRQNAEDSRAAGTMAVGEKHGGAKLTIEKVRTIRASNLSSYKLAGTMDVAASTIRGIRNGHGNWKWLTR